MALPYLTSAWRLAQVGLRLGPANVARWAFYRLLLATGIYRRLLPVRPPCAPPFLVARLPARPSEHGGIRPSSGWTESATDIVQGSSLVFSSRRVATGFPPDWQLNVLSGRQETSPPDHWSSVREFALSSGDIKGVWELSRFDGFLILGLATLAGEKDFLPQMNQWLDDWTRHNPANLGINWKCGQETAIRALHVVTASGLLERSGYATAGDGLFRFVAQHCERVSATMLYAIAQDNNHAISEAVALYVGGGWLRVCGSGSSHAHPGARGWQERGRRLLARAVRRLFLPDGGFAQYSVNYHRLALDLVSIAEVWRRWLGDRPFDSDVLARCAAAADWLASVTDATSGGAPNLGANDGARVFALHHLPFRDFRPSVQLATALFRGQRRYIAGPWDEPLSCLGIDVPADVMRRAVRAATALDSCAIIEASPAIRLVMRLPHLRFRPAHADALHVDLWSDGTNLLRDGGSYGYNADTSRMNYFSGTGAHNTVQFDGRDQMLRLGRFLFGNWVRPTVFARHDGVQSAVSAGYRDYCGATHQRTCRIVSGTEIEVIDEVAGFREQAVLRWRLVPERWEVIGATARSARAALSIAADAPLERVELVRGLESPNYGEIVELPVLEAQVSRPCTIVTRISLGIGG